MGVWNRDYMKRSGDKGQAPQRSSNPEDFLENFLQRHMRTFAFIGIAIAILCIIAFALAPK